MDSLQPMRIFVSVVQNGNLSSAGRQLGLSPASISRHISALEKTVGCRLVNRTSRKELVGHVIDARTVVVDF